MNFRITTLALALAATSSAIKIKSTDVFDDIGDAFLDAAEWTGGAAYDAADWIGGAANDAYDWSKGAANDAYDWSEGAANSIADFAKDNQDWLIDSGEALLPMGMYMDMFGDELYSGVEDLVED